MKPRPETIFYDGECGLCHRWVQFVIPRDTDGSKFAFAPLQGDTFATKMTESERANLPDSIVVELLDGELLMKSTAILHVLCRIGGIWSLLGNSGRIIPKSIRDFAYDRVASIRHHLFKKPKSACPLMPPELRHRFLT